MTNHKRFNEKAGEQAFPSLAVTSEQSARSDRMADLDTRETSQLDSSDWAKILNGDFFIWRERLADGWPHERVLCRKNRAAAAATGDV